MAFELSAEHLEILSAVRDNLRKQFLDGERTGSRFICNQIREVVQAREGLEREFRNYFSVSDAGKDTVNTLRGAILVALRGEETLNAYTHRFSNAEYSVGAVDLARLAWLDTMIETGVLA